MLLLISFYLSVSSTQMTIDRLPPRPFKTMVECEAARDLVLKQSTAQVRVSAICVPESTGNKE